MPIHDRTSKALSRVLVLIVGIGLATSLVTAPGLAAPQDEDPTEPDVVVANRTPERNTFFPSITKASNGDLLATFYDSPVHATNAEGRLAMVRSTDSGLTWSEPEVIIDEPGIDDRGASITRLSTGRLIVNFFRRDLPVEHVRDSYVSYSDDDGDTWSEPVKVGTSMSRSATSSAVLELSDGSLLIPIYGWVSEDVRIHQVTLVRSTDGGVTWPASNEVVVAYKPGGQPIGLNEPALADFGQGRLAVLMRSSGDPENRGYLSLSDDNGLTWSEPERLSFSPHAPNILPINGRSVLVTWGDRAPGETGRPVKGRIVTATQDFEQHAEHTIYENPGVFDMSYPGSVQISPTTFFTVYYDSQRGFIGGTYTHLSDYVRSSG